ncbi:hypothetical protein [Neobacillus sp.]|uniref:hypothetical protein n=1 Tax=Neobacillus sp. TaxID=2675273 RepID=UPI0035B52F51
MLKLVVDNSNGNKKNMITCRNACDLFDYNTESCSIKNNVNVDSPYETSRCGHFLNKASMNYEELNSNFRFSLIGDEDDFLIDDEEIFHELIGTKASIKQSTYPLNPDFPSKRDDAKWFVSPDGQYGCWIINMSKKPMPLPINIEQAEKGWNKNVYKSPIPLHDHKTSLTLASKVAWVIDEEGYGQYCLLVNGKISTISSPKPYNWNKSK